MKLTLMRIEDKKVVLLNCLIPSRMQLQADHSVASHRVSFLDHKMAILSSLALWLVASCLGDLSEIGVHVTSYFFQSNQVLCLPKLNQMLSGLFLNIPNWVLCLNLTKVLRLCPSGEDTQGASHCMYHGRCRCNMSTGKAKATLCVLITHDGYNIFVSSDPN